MTHEFSIASMSEETKQPGFFDGNPKMIFAFGLVAGVALTSVLGDMNLSAGTANADDTDVVVDDTDTGAAPVAGKLAGLSDNDHILGNKDAKVVIIEYSDFECPFCERHHPTMQQIVDEYGDDVAWVYRHFPLSFHPEAKPSALASECASEQGKFWEYADELFANQDKLGDEYYTELASELGLNAKEFSDCYDNEEYASVVTEQTASGRTAGVSGTPATFVNGQLVSGAVPFETFKEMIDAELAE